MHHRLIPGKALDPASPWKVTQDYLNALPPSTTPLSTLTPLGLNKEPIRALKSNRRTRLMAIFNVTTDSFSDGGEHLPPTETDASPKLDRRPQKLDKFIENGATIIDIGGQSTAPGAKDVPVELETERVLDAISLLQDKNILISVDTFRAPVAEAAVKAGAHIINDVSAGVLDPEMLPTMARLGTTVCLMHMRGTPQTMMKKTDYSPDGLIPTVAKELLERVAAAEEAGIRRWRIILDPGIGFAKNLEQNLELLRRFDELRNWPGLRGLPWLVGTSRKSFIRRILGVQTIAHTLLGTSAIVAAAIEGGADIVRVHDVSHMAKVVKVADAIWRV
jgi:2-amino-4-hydroxy-6-hydroxymethyldihydropteridine diphosphokinase / dihydropteroate synthase